MIGNDAMKGSHVAERLQDASPWADVGEMLRDLIARRGDAPVFRFLRDGAWADMAWREFGAAAAASGLEARARGLEAGDAVAILAGTRPEWMMADVGAVCTGLVSTGIYPTEPAAKAAYVINDCRARVVFVDTAEQVEKLLAIRAECPSVEVVVVFEDSAVPDGDSFFVSFRDWIAAGHAYGAVFPDAWSEAGGQIAPEDPAILIYTSGTTGPPKGAIIPHRALVYQCVHGPGIFRMQPGYVRPAFLPLCHVAERMFTYLSMVSGMVCAFVDGPNQLLQQLPVIRPQFFVAVPRVYEKLVTVARAWIDTQPTDRRDALLAAQARALAQGAPGLVTGDSDALGEIRRAVGLDRAEVLISGGARCSDDVDRWLRAMGAPARDLYGMTECGMVAVNFDDVAAPGIVGVPCEYGEVRLGDQDEIQVRGRHVFTGYLNQPEKTAEVLRDGWYSTGDVGKFDADGRLLLIDRLKDLIISSSGKNISPSEVEGALKASPFIADAVAIGDGRHYLSALILIDPEAVGAALSKAPDFEALARSEQTHQLIQQAVDTANRGLSRPESIKVFRILPRPLNVEDGVLTPTLKIKRRAMAELFSDLIEEMYQAPERDRARA